MKKFSFGRFRAFVGRFTRGRQNKVAPAEFSIRNFKPGVNYICPSFQIQEKSHAKSISLLSQNTGGRVNVDSRFLLPSELWGTVRALSHSAFARINQTVVSGAEWKILAKVPSGEVLKAETVLEDSRVLKGGIPVSKWKTVVKDSKGRIVAEQADNYVTLNDFQGYRYVERQTPLVRNFGRLLFEQSARGYKRFDWNPQKWEENIHNDEPARRFGYEKGLPEFTTYFDLIFNAAYPALGSRLYEGTSIRLKRIKPIYEGDEIKIAGYVRGEKIDVFFLKGNDVRLEAELRNPSFFWDFF